MASARLMKRADEDGSLQNNNLNESFVQYGTPLPSLASTKKDQGEYVPVWKQEVRDEQGRRRLHGAFTGGFSAGYYNTAGSKEGWTPSTFVSKKEAKGKQRAEQRPEDYMDEEDLAELKSSRTFKTTEGYGGGQTRPEDAFAGLGSTPTASTSNAANAQDPGYSAAVANSLKDLVKPGSRRIGQKIMTKMGWRPGQGIGPRISYARRKEQMREMGIQLDDEEDDQEDEEAKKHTFAPLDRTVLTFENKENQWGLGYVPGQTLGGRFQDQNSSLAGSSYSVPVSDQARFGRNGQKGDAGPQSRMPVGGAFGISALEDADEDDLDVYGSGISEARTLVLNDEEDDDDNDAPFGSAYGGTRKPQLMKWNDRIKQDGRAGRRPADSAVRQQQQTFTDGSPMLSGFVLASRTQPPDKWFPSEPVPKNWQPNPKAIWERERLKASTSASAGVSNIPPAQKKGQQNMLSADDRANILGEPVAPKSVFDFLSAKDKERIQSLGRGEASSSAGPQVAGPSREPEALRVPNVDSRVAQSALKGFMPYGDDPAKQVRYKAFLQHHAMPQDASKPFQPPPPPGKSISELNTELEAFANAAMIFKPMSGMMANRFTSSSGQSAILDIKAPEAGLYVPKPVSDAQKLMEQNEEEKKRKMMEEREAADPRRLAVREGNFGLLTRTVEPWYPSKLLCKRFNVADPHPEGPAQSSHSSHPFAQASASRAESDILSQSAMDTMMQDRKSANTGDGFVAGVSFPSTHSDAPSAGAADVDIDATAQDEAAHSYEKPPMDIFKAIFASDDEDDDMEEDEVNTVVATSTQAQQTGMPVDDPSKAPDTTLFDAKPVATPPTSLTIEDLSSFKPTFVSRSDRAISKDESKKKDKDKKKKKKASAIVSFDIEDEEEGSPVARDTGTDSKKRKSGSKSKDGKLSKKERKTPNSSAEGADEDEWVEKETGQLVPPAAANGREQEQGAGQRKNGRVTASELF